MATLAGPRNILVAVDFSENARRAAQYGVILAEKFGARLTLAHVFQSQEYFADVLTTSSRTTNSILESYYSKAREKVQLRISNLASEIAINGVKPEAKILSDEDSSIVGAIIDYAEKSGSDLIVVGNRGQGGFKRLVLGSVSQGITNHSGCSVLVVR